MTIAMTDDKIQARDDWVNEQIAKHVTELKRMPPNNRGPFLITDARLARIEAALKDEKP